MSDNKAKDSFDSWVKSYRPDFSEEEGRFAAECFLELPMSEREAKADELFLNHPDIVYPLMDLLRAKCEISPAVVRDDAEYLYRLMRRVPTRERHKPRSGYFLMDEREHFLGEAAFIAGTTCRVLSRREESRGWFDLAESWFLLTFDPAGSLSRLLYQRLALMVEERRFKEVLEVLPQLIEGFRNQEHPEQELKCRFLEGGALKESEQQREAAEVFREVCRQARELGNEKLLAGGLINLLQLHSELNEPAQALAVSEEAIPLLRRLGNRIQLGKVQCGLGMLYRRQGNAKAAIEAFRAAQMEFEDIQMRADVAALHLIVADILLDQDQDAQARWEIHAALPVIEEYKLVPEGVAALSLLRQSLRNHRIDQKALRELHGYFPARES